MTGRSSSRRTFLKVAGGAAAAAVGGGAVASQAVAQSSPDAAWSEASSPTSKSITSVVQTADGPHAVGSSGNVLALVDGEWRLVVDSGPSASNNPLNDVAITSDGERIWFAGGSGAMGAYDVETGKKYDYTAPDGKTSTWEAIAATGAIDREHVIVANGSGEVLHGVFEENDEGAYCIQWGDVVKPAGGSTIPGVAFSRGDTDTAYGISTSQAAFETTDYNQTWTKIGVSNANESFYDVLGDDDVVYVSAGGGTIYRYDCGCRGWTPVDVGENALQGLDRLGPAEPVMAAGNGGYVYERTADGWQEYDTPVGSDIYDVAYGGDGGPDVAVGSGGTILER